MQKNKLNLRICGIHLLNPYKIVVSHLNRSTVKISYTNHRNSFKDHNKKMSTQLSKFNCPIERVKETIFLGVVLDEHLNWKAHISNVSRKIPKSIGIIFKFRFCLSLFSLRTLYYEGMKEEISQQTSTSGAHWYTNNLPENRASKR